MLAQIIRKLFPGTARQIYNEGKAECREMFENQKYENKMSQLTYELNHYVGKPVIVFGNEYEDPIVATIVGYEGNYGRERGATASHLPLIKLATTGEVHITFGKLVLFTPDRLKALVELGPEMRWNLLAGSCQMYNHQVIRPKEDVVCKTYAQIMDELAACGWLEQWEASLGKNLAKAA